MKTITVYAPVKIAVPRGATVAAAWFVAFLGWLENVADRRVRSRQLVGRVEEATRVRRLGQQLMAHDPRFAADLFAAADRHERD